MKKEKINSSQAGKSSRQDRIKELLKEIKDLREKDRFMSFYRMMRSETNELRKSKQLDDEQKKEKLLEICRNIAKGLIEATENE